MPGSFRCQFRVRDDAGAVVRWIGINTDVDDQKRAHELVGDTLESMDGSECDARCAKRRPARRRLPFTPLEGISNSYAGAGLTTGVFSQPGNISGDGLTICYTHSANDIMLADPNAGPDTVCVPNP
ncbi:MAG: hypothetical protein IPK60_00510 [Sandaracinaceae bacterium]|jgi:hypothetical protein|nr:hypothetical protein [Sandaracinaceae bacterium]